MERGRVMGIVDILSAPSGGLIYHLITLFAIQAVFGMALDEWHRHRQIEFQRLMVAFGTLLGTRLVLMLAALVTSRGWLLAQNVLPPLERCFDLVTVTMVLFAFLPRDLEIGRITRSACLINLALALIVYGVFAPLWYMDATASPLLGYNGYWQEIVWEVWQVLLLVWAVVALRQGAVPQRRLVLSSAVVLLIGHLLHLFLRQGPPHIAGWERVAGLIASALWVAATYRAVVTQLVARELSSDRDNWTAVGQLRETEKLYEEVERICASLELPVVLDRATQSALKIFEARLCAILLFDPRAPETMRMAAVRRADGTYETDLGSVDAKSTPILRQALVHRRQVTIEAGSDDSPGWQQLLAAFNSRADETLAVTPLLSGPQLVGVMVVGDAATEWIVPQVQGSGRVLTALIGAAVGHALLSQVLGSAKVRPPAAAASAPAARPVTPAAPSPATQPVIGPTARTAVRPGEVAAAQLQLEQARREVVEIEETVRSLRSELAERNRQLAQLSQSLKNNGSAAETGATMPSA
jgi:hypothetical protein